MAHVKTSSSRKRAVQVALWVLVVLAPIVSYVVMGIASGTSLLSLDAWNTTWNDEQRHYRTVQQMRAVGAPSGIAGYDEVPAARPSWGPYCALTYVPYYIGTFFAGFEGHNFMYVINGAFGVLACLIAVIVLRPDTRQSILLAVLFGTHFVIARYLCSGMTEGSYVLYAAVFSVSTLVALKHADSGGRRWPVYVAFAVMVLATGLWGGMRPYVLAFMLVPWSMLVVCDYGMSRWLRVVFAVVGAIVAVAGLAYYMYASKYYATPYLSTSSFADSFVETLAAALPGLPGQHIDCVLYSGAKLIRLQWRGIMMFSFAAGWVALLALGVRALRRKDKVRAALCLSLVIVGFLCFEANLLLYSYRQMYRTMIVVVVVYLVAIVFLGADLRLGRKVSVSSACIAVVCLVCCLSLVKSPSSFAYPQVSAGDGAGMDTRQQLEQVMPQSDDQWANTLAHPIEGGNMHLYFSLPVYMNTNNLRMSYLEKAVKKGTLKSKYLGVPIRSDVNKKLRKRYEVIYEGEGHVIYKVW